MIDDSFLSDNEDVEENEENQGVLQRKDVKIKSDDKDNDVDVEVDEDVDMEVDVDVNFEDK